MAIKIPSTHEEPLRSLVRVEESKRTAFLAALRIPPALIDPKELIDRVQADVGLDEKVVSAWIWMLMSMYLASSEAEGDFAEQVCQAARELTADEVDKDAIDWTAFASDLRALLSCHDSLGVTAKAIDVRREYGALFCRARIITDVRPVFGPDPASAPLAGAIVHTLRVAYHDGEQHKDFYVALDSRDLRELRDLLDRATKKETSLREQIQKTDMRYLELETN